MAEHHQKQMVFFSAENQMEEIMAERKTGETAPQKKQAQEQRVADQENSALQLDVRIHSIRPNESIKATASVNIGGAFAIRGVKVVEGSKGLFVSMPSMKVGSEYKDICFPITAESRDRLNQAVLTAYEQAMTQGQNSVQKHHEMQQAPEGQPMEMTGM